jgi:hypothetical protein
MEHRKEKKMEIKAYKKRRPMDLFSAAKIQYFKKDSSQLYGPERPSVLSV